MKASIAWITINTPLVNRLTSRFITKAKKKELNAPESIISLLRFCLINRRNWTVLTLCLFLYTSTVQVALSATIGVTNPSSQNDQSQNEGRIINSPKNDISAKASGDVSRQSAALNHANSTKHIMDKAISSPSVKMPLFDGKLDQGFQTDQLTLVTISLAKKHSLSAIDVYGLADFVLSAEAQINGQWYALENFQLVDLRQLTNALASNNEASSANSNSPTPSTVDGWHRLSFAKKITTNKLRLRLKPVAGNPTQALKELRLVGESNVIDVNTASYIQDQGQHIESAHDNVRIYRANQPIQTVNHTQSLKQSKQAEFSVDLGYSIDQIEKATLQYTVLGVNDALEVIHRINDQLSIGGLLTVKDDEKVKPSVTRHEEQIPASSLRLGRNHLYFHPIINSDYQVMDVGLRIVLKPDQVNRSDNPAIAIESMPKMELTFPDKGQYLGSTVYVRGFVEADEQGRYPDLTILDYPLQAVDGLFEGLIPRGESDELTIKANWAGGHEQRLSQDLSEDMSLKGYALSTLLSNGETSQLASDVSQPSIFSSFQVAGKLQQKKQVNLSEDKQASLEVSGSQLNVPLNSVSKALKISGVGLRERDMAILEMGMVNVTKAVSGYRFLPHGMQFDQAIKVSLPYDKALIPPGYSEDDIRSYYFDPLASRWVPLERTLVDIKMSRIESESNHFTDMINAVVQVPDSPQAGIHNPTQFSGMQAANPAAKINEIAPPSGNSSGDAALSYPLEVPPGRAGLQPSLAVSYNSSGGNGWMGVGWNLSTPSIRVETRWGVPRYDSINETESYLFNGQQLTPLAHRGDLLPRESEKQFHLRVESGFVKIIRHGSHPSNYWWEVIDKQGTHTYYGGVNGADANSTLADAAGNIAVWSLTLVQDSNGNQMDYRSVKVLNNGQPGGTVPGQALYIDEIQYTGHANGQTGPFTVNFIRESGRDDVMIDGRYGFKQVVGDLLTRAEVRYQGGLVRAYDFNYKTGAFHKQLLESVVQYDANNVEFNRHDFSYYDESRSNPQSSPNSYYGYTSPTTWNTGHDNVRGNLLFGDKASAISGYKGKGDGYHFYFGYGYSTKPGKGNSVGLKIGGNTSESQGLLRLIDINGDGLADKVFRNGGTIYYRANRLGANGISTFDVPVVVANLPAISQESNSTSSWGAEWFPGGENIKGHIGFNEATSTAISTIFFSDVNSDGLVDLVNKGTVLFNHINAWGHPEYTTSSADTPYPIAPGVIAADEVLVDLQDLYEEQIDQFPLIDTVRRWIAPFDGLINISGAPSLQSVFDNPSADGVRVAIQHNSSPLWSAMIDVNGTAPLFPGLSGISVNRGDVVYFRIQSILDGSNDLVDWSPRIEYMGVPRPTLDVDGLDVYTYDASEDFTLAGFRDIDYVMFYDGAVKVAGTILKNAQTSDDITVEILKNAVPVYSETLAHDAIGNIVLDEMVDVTKEVFDVSGTVITPADHLAVRVVTDSPVDLSQIQWDSTNPLRIYYESSTDPELTEVVDSDGNPLVQYDVLPEIELYSENDLTAPLQPWLASTTGLVKLTVKTDPIGLSGSAVLVVKKQTPSASQPIAKQVLDLVTGTTTLEIDVSLNDVLYFQVVSREYETGESLNSYGIKVDYLNTAFDEAIAIDAGLYYPSKPSIVAAAYRGWNVFGYNGNRDRANQAIQISDDDLLPTAQFDPATIADTQAAIQDAVNTGGTSVPGLPSPSDQVLHSYTPNIMMFRFNGPSKALWADANTGSSSRLGVESITVPTAESLSGSRAAPTISKSKQFATAASVDPIPDSETDETIPSGSLSYSTTDSDGILDYMDINGDRFPDIIGSGKVQFSSMIGGLEEQTKSFAGLTDQIRSNEAKAFNLGGGGNYAHTICNSKGECSKGSKESKTKSGIVEQIEVSLGVSGDIASGSSDAEHDLIDINGDGLVDRVSIIGDQLFVQLNVGYQFLAKEPWSKAKINHGVNSSFTLNPSAGATAIIGKNKFKYGFGLGINVSESISSSIYSLLDVNGDGLLDRVRYSAFNSHIVVGLNTGNQFMEDILWPTSQNKGLAVSSSTNQGAGIYITLSFPLILIPGYLITNPGYNFSSSAGRTKTSILDVNGDGYPDYLHSTEDDELSVSLAQIERTNMLKRVERPLGASFTLDYERSGNTYAQPHNRWVLNRVEIDDGFTGDGVDTLLTTYQYEDGYYDRREREFYGYARVIQEQRDASSAEALYRRQISEFNNANYYEKGLMLTSWLEDAAGNVYSESTNRYAVRDVDTGILVSSDHLNNATETLYPHLERSDQRIYEGLPSAIKSTHSTFEYDQFGNTIRIINANDIGSEDDVEAVIEYHYDLTSYIVAKPNKITVYGDGDVYRRRESSIELGTGNVLQVRALLADGAAVVSDLLYDDYGNLVKVTGPPNQIGQRYERQFSYDTIVQQYVVQFNDSFGYTSTAQYDFRWGVPIKQIDINGYPIETSYDSIGRVVSVTGPYQQGTGRSTISFTYTPEATVPWALTQHYDNYQHQSDPIETYTFIDGLGRAVQTKKDHSLATGLGNQPVMVVSGRQIYDHLGRVVESYYPVTEALGTQTQFNPQIDTIAPIIVQYDVLDRMIQTTLPDLTQMTVAQMTVEYGQGMDKNGQQRLLKRVTDANGISSESYADVRGLMLFTRQHNLAGGQDNIWTQFDYNPMNELLSVTDDQGNVTTSQYDHLGRRTSVDSPDGGLTTTEYDLASNMIAITTANLGALGQSLRYEYDYNRLKQLVYPANAQKNVYYHYGAPGASDNRVGRLARVEDESGWIEYSYGSLGEQVKTYRQLNYNAINCGSVCTRDYETGFVYDSWNRLQGIVYPDGEVLHYDYDSGGALKSVTGVKDDHVYGYVRSIQYDKFGQRVALHYGNGVTTDYKYDEQDRVLVEMTAGYDGDLFMDYRYQYDAVNNITAIDNLVGVYDIYQKGGEAHFTYQYDDLYRLTSSSGVFIKPDQTHRYNSSMEYDRLHSFINKKQHYEVEYNDGTVIEQTGKTYDFNYRYEGTQPHAPSKIGDKNFQYDANGNQLGWQLDGSIVSREIVWDAHNRISAVNDNVVGTSQYIYDHTGTRAIKEANGNLISYINGYYVTRRGAGSVAQGSKHIFAGTDRVGSKLVVGEADAALGITQALATQIGLGIPEPTDPQEIDDPDGNSGGNPFGMTLEEIEELAAAEGVSVEDYIASLAQAAGMTVEEFMQLLDEPIDVSQQMDELTEHMTWVASAHGLTLEDFIELYSEVELEEMINDPIWIEIREEMVLIWEQTWEWIEVFEWWNGYIYCISNGYPNEYIMEYCTTEEDADGSGGGSGSGGSGTGDPQLYEDYQYYYHANQVGSTTFLSDTYGYAVEHSQYFPFGELWIDETEVSRGTNPSYLFTGKEIDQQTGLYYYGARYYDPKTSIWLSVDPLAEKYPGITPYAYSAQNPISNKEVDGRYFLFVPGLAYSPDPSYTNLKYVEAYSTMVDNIDRSHKGLGGVTVSGSRSGKSLTMNRFHDALYTLWWGSSVRRNIRNDYRAMRIINHTAANYGRVRSAGDNFNILATSQGTVTIAQAVVAMLKDPTSFGLPEDFTIDNLFLAGSMVDPNSKLGVALDNFSKSKQIKNLMYISAPNDTIEGIAGKSRLDAFRNIKKFLEMYRSEKKREKSMGDNYEPLHSHVRAAENYSNRVNNGCSTSACDLQQIIDPIY